jgi:hypothetical protein
MMQLVTEKCKSASQRRLLLELMVCAIIRFPFIL